MGRLSLNKPKYNFKKINHAPKSNGMDDLNAPKSNEQSINPCGQPTLKEPRPSMKEPRPLPHSSGTYISKNLTSSPNKEIQVDPPALAGRDQAKHSLPVKRRSHPSPVDQVIGLEGRVNPHMSNKPSTSYECGEDPGGVLTLPTPSTMTYSSGDPTPPAGIGLFTAPRNGTPWGTKPKCGVTGQPSHYELGAQTPSTTPKVSDQVADNQYHKEISLKQVDNTHSLQVPINVSTDILENLSIWEDSEFCTSTPSSLHTDISQHNTPPLSGQESDPDMLYRTQLHEY